MSSKQVQRSHYYYPAIDGMRAVAVIAVVIFHAEHHILPGGFVGVDVFFVISGYLITNLIVKEIETGSFSMLRFYQRRIARIFPAFLAVTAFVLAAASVCYSPQDYASAGAVALSAALSATNMKLMLQGNYFEVSPDAQPFLHFWSLAVEEQFYFFLPVLLVLLFWFRLRVTQVAWVLGVLLTLSFFTCIALTIARPTWAFYLLPTRAWELLVGSLVAFIPRRPSHPRRKTFDILGIAGISLLLISFFAIRESTNFPGFLVLVPVLGAALLLWSSLSSSCFISRTLEKWPMVAIGKLSYSLYLWHWPIFCFVDYCLFDSPYYLRLLLKVAGTVVTSLACHHFFENPARKYLNRPNNRSIGFAVLLIGCAAVATIGISIRNHNYVNAESATVSVGGLAFNQEAVRPRMVLMGDSNASMYGALVRDVGSNLNFRTNVISSAASSPLPGSRLWNDSIVFLKRERPKLTIYVAAWSQVLSNNPNKIRHAIEELLEHSDYVILVTQPPILPATATREWIRTHGSQPIFEDESIASARNRANSVLMSQATDRVIVIDSSEKFFDKRGLIRFVDKHHNQLFHDRTHLSGYGAKEIRSDLETAIILTMGTDISRAHTN